METSSKKRSATNNNDNHSSNLMNQAKKKKTASSLNINESPIAGTRITDWEEYEKWKEVRGDIEPTMNYVEITPEAIEELRKIKNIIGDYICQLCKVKYENAFALAMHKCPRVVHIEFRYIYFQEKKRFQIKSSFSSCLAVLNVIKLLIVQPIWLHIVDGINLNHQYRPMNEHHHHHHHRHLQHKNQ